MIMDDDINDFIKKIEETNRLKFIEELPPSEQLLKNYNDVQHQDTKVTFLLFTMDNDIPVVVRYRAKAM
jgi:hypothetical protein